MSVIIDDAKNIGSHVVALNNLMTELNKESRQTFKPDLVAIQRIMAKIKHHATEIEESINREAK